MMVRLSPYSRWALVRSSEGSKKCTAGLHSKPLMATMLGEKRPLVDYNDIFYRDALTDDH